jgi:protein ImuA
MAATHDLQTLRHRVRALTVIGAESPEAIAFGEDEIDSALPDGGLATGAVHEFLPESQSDFAATLGFGLGLLTRLMQVRTRPILWTAPTYETFRCGIAYPVGLAVFGFDPNRLNYLAVDNAKDVLWAMEEALGSASLAAVIGILPRQDKAYDFTASRRLSLRAASSGVTAFLIRQDTGPDKPTAAATRWSIATRQSAPQWRKGLSTPGLGPPSWRANLVRCKRGRPRSWLVEWDHETFSFRLASPLAHRAPAVAGAAIAIQPADRQQRRAS